MWSYRASDVARTLGLTPSRVRAWARQGLVAPRRGPRGELRFSFQDLVLLRTARDLLAASVPAVRVKRALRQLRAQLPEGRSLATVRISADGERLVVRDGSAAWHPDSGQALLDFAVRDVAASVAPLLRQAARGAVPEDADAFYEWGCDLEDGAPDEALAAYRRALALEPGHLGAHVNLGRMLHEAGDPAAAEEHYRRALEAHPRDAGALYNLGVALEDQGRRPAAVAAYRDSLAADPSNPDCHLNLARLLEVTGRREEALRHLAAARRLVPAASDREDP